MNRWLIRYLHFIVSLAIRRWDDFWFATRSTFDIGLARVAIGLLAAVYAASWCIDLNEWIDADRKLNTPVTRYLIGDHVQGTGSLGRFSMLYGFESAWLVQCYLIVTSLTGLAMALGVGGRIVAALAWVLTLGIVHRVPMLQGAGDMLFTSVMGYLVIDPGKTRRWWRVGLDDHTNRWSSNLAIRLMQCHVWIWFAVSLISHLAEPMWWTGSGVWWLASAGRSPWLSGEFLSDKPYLINALTLGFLVLHAITIGLLVKPLFRPWAIVTCLLFAVGVWGLAGDWLYALAIFTCTSPFWGTAIREIQLMDDCSRQMNTDLASQVEDAVPEPKKSRGRRSAKRVTS